MSIDISTLDQQTRSDLFDYTLSLGDDRLILGHRLSEWCGKGPMLEEDIALSNISLDCIGQAISFLSLAGKIEGKDRDEDKLAYFREAIDYKNFMLLEQPNGDFASTMVRQFIYDAFSLHLYEKLQTSPIEELAAVAIKSLKEVRYHLRHSKMWVIRLGDGTEESHQRMQNAINELWMFTEELFQSYPHEQRLVEKKLIPDLAEIKSDWEQTIQTVITEATLNFPKDEAYFTKDSRLGNHTEHIGFILATMQILPRSYPEAKW